VIEKIAHTLQRQKDLFSTVLPVTAAKVPIVKFYSPMYRFEGE
jgi:hypothetical protein